MTPMDYMMQIRQKTHLLHEASEKTGYIQKIIAGTGTKEGYGEYLFNLHAMYVAIEKGLDQQASHDVIKDFVTPELYRSQQIRQDATYILGDQFNSMELLASTKACVRRIEEITKTNPILIIGYAYTRFLADLFGGRTFPAILGQSYHIPAEGLNYYQYDNLGDIKSYVMTYHGKLGGVQLDTTQQTELLDEISNAYIYNLAISNELDMKLKA